VGGRPRARVGELCDDGRRNRLLRGQVPLPLLAAVHGDPPRCRGRNDATQADPNWLPLLWTPPEVIPPTFLIPPIPDYPSAAAITSAAATEVLRAQFGDRIRVSVTSTTLPGVTRHFHSLTQTQQEAGMSRVYGGIHFLHAVEDGWEQGKGIGRAVARMLPPARSAPATTSRRSE
jgi:hypothetical protein